MDSVWWFLVILVLMMVITLILTRKKPVVILLTAYVGGDKTKENWYNYAISKYISETNLDVRIVESSGHVFDFDVKQCTFVQPDHFKSSTHGEAYSILKAYECGLIPRNCTVIKVTGKYYLPDLEKEIKKIKDEHDIIYQNSTTDSHQNSEIFGWNSNFTELIFNDIVDSQHIMEKCILKIHEKLGLQSYRLSSLDVKCNGSCPIRGDGSQLLVL